MFCLDGATYSSSLEESFYKTYSYSNFLNYFDVFALSTIE
jgi:hypothetical protein